MRGTLTCKSSDCAEHGSEWEDELPPLSLGAEAWPTCQVCEQHAWLLEVVGRLG